MPNPFLPGHNREDKQQGEAEVCVYADHESCHVLRAYGTHQIPADTPLSGWEGIENHVMKHDTAEMKDYTDDIDTLLVFVNRFLF